ncbi:MAG: hypothetical protein ACOX9C_10965 [Kiritimatiellia bacterium]|jgi:DNA mismatch repair protein MutL
MSRHAANSCARTTEQAHIRNVFVVHAIAHHDVAFSLKCDGDFACQLAAADTLHDRILDIAGIDELERLVPVDCTLGAIRVYGYAGLPSWTRSDRSGQYIYVNRRPAIAPVVLAAITEAYPKLEDNRKPILYLFIDLPPDQVDVNVHPTKREVRFRCLSDVREAVIAALSSALNRAGVAAAPPAVAPGFPPSPSPAPPGEPSATPRPQAVGPVAPPVRPAPSFSFSSAGAPPPSVAPPVEPAFAEPTVEMPDGSPWTRFRIIGRLSTGYVLLETNDGYTVVDPAAAHERVLYEKLLRIADGAPRLSQRLLIPQSVEMKPLDHRRVEGVLSVLTEMGFGIAPFGKSTFIVDAVPDALAGISCEAVLLDTAAALDDAGSSRRGRERWREELVAKAASSACVRTRGPLSTKEMNAIVIELAACEMPYVSPAGRPTMIFTSFRELDRRFGR